MSKANAKEIPLRIDLFLSAALDNEVAIQSRALAAEAAKTGSNPKKQTAQAVIREILREGLRSRALSRGEEFPDFEPVGKMPREIEIVVSDIVHEPMVILQTIHPTTLSELRRYLAEGKSIPMEVCDPVPLTPATAARRRLGVSRKGNT